MSTPDAEELAERLWAEIKPRCVAILRQAQGQVDDPDGLTPEERAKVDAWVSRFLEKQRQGGSIRRSPSKGKRSGRS